MIPMAAGTCLLTLALLADVHPSAPAPALPKRPLLTAEETASPNGLAASSVTKRSASRSTIRDRASANGPSWEAAGAMSGCGSGRATRLMNVWISWCSRAQGRRRRIFASM